MKRLIDIIAALATGLILSPVILTLALLVWLRHGRPVFFRQKRPGLGGKPFVLIKFRTMLDARDRHGRMLDDADRLTPLGKFLRSSSLDELPELWNVLKGDMSLVGPRPLLMQYLDRYNTEQARRHEVRPGITGWAQVNGRNAVDWAERFRLDVWYVDHHNLILDGKIIIMTLIKVLRRDGISAPDEATMHEFMGNTEGERKE